MTVPSVDAATTFWNVVPLGTSIPAAVTTSLGAGYVPRLSAGFAVVSVIAAVLVACIGQACLREWIQ